MAGSALGLAKVLTAGNVLAVLSAVPLAWWFEERVFGALVTSGTGKKLIIFGVLGLAGSR